ncbi:hypothetical protein BVX98_02385 [bacterium F11]|nr:hypothetical protein BVX98_02385 [bacterium F11]
MVLVQILIATVLVGLISFIGLVFFGIKANIRKITFYLISLASGTMLGAAFLHLIPESLEKNSSHPMLMVACGVFLFFILEKFLIWRHCHHHQRPEDHSRPVAASMILVGDAVHNFIDGIIIAGSFLAGPGVGISITIAIILHEIPQELGDFGVLIHGGLTVRKALMLNALSASAAVVGGVLTYLSAEMAVPLQTFILPLAAGGFLYIALADLIPQLHEHVDLKPTLAQIILLGMGFCIILLLKHH